MFYNLYGNVWAGPYPGRGTIETLVGLHGVRSFVNLTRPDEKLVFGIRSYRRFLTDGAAMRKFELWTYDLPPVETLLQVVGTLMEDEPSYLHCRHGLDRTGTVAVLTLMKRFGLRLDDALAELNRRRSGLTEPSPRKRYHFRYLKNAEAHLFGTAGKEPTLRRAVFDDRELRKAMQEEIGLITVKGKLAQPVHRALRAVDAGVHVAEDLFHKALSDLPKLLIRTGMGPKEITAVLLKVGPSLTSELAKNYREAGYDAGTRECLLKLKE
ncbi:MAG: hypothetical protein V2B18_24265 [Pseudomonadota bacterium]